ncbi:MAG: enoyl-CoA hydratase/isomerase family protein [Ectothiorhodospiraceae bacterium]|nr:enoyl-CoA hydratase/isomerase family protein [Chromatiales bacterium]MCP5156745.1 enoyl-CoA hydratase/isomerase family protein [Ectothiorhodospiraceae bacterium]
MTADPVLMEVDARGIAHVTLNRPHVNNAYDGALIEGLLRGIDAIAADPRVRLVVIRGNGRHFQAGADLAWINALGKLGPDENREASRRTARAVLGLDGLDKPTLALVHGGCFGGGVGMLCACDVVIASEDAIFAITEARWGLAATIIVPQLVAALGIRDVRRYALTCERFDARRALEIGLVHEVCPTGGLEAAAAPVIESLLRCGPDALALTKRLCREDAHLDLSDEHLERLVALHSDKRRSAEAAEGTASFLEKRDPSWYPA